MKKLDISDFYISSIEYEGNNLRTVLEDNKSPENRFIISADDKTFLILHKDYEITGYKELAASLNWDSVNIFIIKTHRALYGIRGIKESQAHYA